ncbi:MAG: hypothetical protein ACP5HU_08525 [Phycisphaerae bacterium]
MQEADIEKQAEAEQRPNLIDLWEDRDGKSTIAAFLQAAALVMKRNGRLADHLDLPLDYSSAKRFRWAALAPVFVVIALALLPWFAILAGKFIWPEMEVLADPPTWALIVLPVVTVVMVLLLWGLWTGMVSWFFDSRKLKPWRRHRAIALSYYLSAPLALLAIPMGIAAYIATQLMTDAFSDGPPGSYPVELGGAASTLFICVMVYWLQMIVFAARDVIGRRVPGLVATAVVLPILWVLTAVLVLLLPVGVMMWVFMYYSLAV